jgi:hypothetical protein
MTKTFKFGDIDVVAVCVSVTKILVVVTNGFQSNEMEFNYPSEYLCDVAFDDITEELAATLANGCGKLFFVHQKLSN